LASSPALCTVDGENLLRRIQGSADQIMTAERPLVEVRVLHPDEFPAAIRLLARGFRDEPLQIASLGPDPVRRHQRILVLFGALFEIMDRRAPLVALDGGRMVGVTGVAPPGTCQPSMTSHLGPLAVHAELQGRGIGSQILRHYCQQLDEAGLPGYLETDSEDKVGLYTRFGFAVVREEQVIGIPNWFMERPS
jgi:predicted N-acetyltransferase YhbS